MFDLEDDWVWDFWTLPEDLDGMHHLFFLHAPRSWGDPDLRHSHARVGYAVSHDLRSWTRRPDPLPPPGAAAHDSMATWTGSTTLDHQGRWWLFTSGLSEAERGRVQRVGSAVSEDQTAWRPTDLVLEADPRWYAVPVAGEVHWRDPFVIEDADGLWHMYITAKAPGRRGNGVVGHATSWDLRVWEIRPPIGPATGIFDQLEVVSLAQVEGRWVMVFSCLGPEIVGAAPGDGGVWTVPVEGPGAAVRIELATRLTSEALYVGRVVNAASGPPGPGGPALLAFVNQDEAGCFVGGVTDPIPVRWRADGRGLELDPAADVPDHWRPSGSADLVAG